MTDLPPIAVIADAHFHDTHSDYGCTCTTIDGKQLTLRSWQDTRKSSRVFNESKDALITALNDIQQRGVRHVVLLGDYTDDGQIESTKRIANLLHHYRCDYDIAFYAIPGNHDFYGPAGKHQSTRFVSTAGSTLVTSDPEVAVTEGETSVLTRNMYCEGSPAGLLPMADFGLFKRPEYHHWETPFGTSDAADLRMYDARSADGSVKHSLMDASYLVEPSDGIWLLMIDANVFEPRNGQSDPARKKTFFDSSDAGWNAVLRVKPFLIDWIRDVCTRAKSSGKQLLAFSHYPTIDPIDQHTMSEARLFGNNLVVRRTPDVSVANALIAAGLNLHFSGHMHVNNATHHKNDGRTLSDIAVPSLVSFPACYKLIRSTPSICEIDTIPIGAMPVDSTLINHYRAQTNPLSDEDESALSATTYGEFLYRRIRTRVKYHYLIKEWPADIACEIDNTTTADLAYLLLAQKNSPQTLRLKAMSDAITEKLASDLYAAAAQYELTRSDFDSCSMMTLIADWYCLRQAGPLAKAYISSKNLALYTCLVESVDSSASGTSNTHAAFFKLLMGNLGRSIKSLGPIDKLTETNRTVTITQMLRY